MRLKFLKLIGLAASILLIAGCSQIEPEQPVDEPVASAAAVLPTVDPTDWPLVRLPQTTAANIPAIPAATSSAVLPIVNQPASLPPKVLHGVPFTVQAPLADWADPRQQDGCEEAAILMASRWVKDQTLTKEEALAEILALAAFQKEHYGYSQDTSATATARLLQDYFQISSEVRFDITRDDIREELASGKIVITPMNGQTLGNPNYRQPGPERHMLLIIGYDDQTQEFSTNDAGTRRGKGYRYGYDQLVSAIRDYPSGEHREIVGQRKAMIVVGK